MESIQALINENEDTSNNDNNTQLLATDLFIELWNPPDLTFSFDNGILLTGEKNNSSKSTQENSNNDSNDNKIIGNSRIYGSDFIQILQFDEQKYRWYFCNLNFKQFFNKSEQNAVIPLILFIDSKEESVIRIAQCLKKSNFNFESEENISVFVFQKDALNNMQQNEEPYFMFVHIPKKKQNIPYIGVILYQIYTFLFMICDLSIVILDEKLEQAQISFIAKIIEINKFYLQGNENIFIDKSNISFLHFKHIKSKDRTSKLNNIISECITKKYQINCLNDAKDFIDVFNEIPLNQCYCYSDIEKLFIHAESLFPQISALYIKHKTYVNNIYSELQETIMDMYSTYSPMLNFDSRMLNLINECKVFYPTNDNRFASYIELILIKLKLDNGISYSKEIKAKLIDQSRKNLNYLKVKINEKSHWTLKQMTIIKDSHTNYLQTQYFDIIKEITNNCYIELFYEKNINILNEQIKQDKEEIDSYFFSFLTNLQKKEKIVENDYQSETMKGTNYVMREVQRMREIEVVIAEGEELETIIEQDF